MSGTDTVVWAIDMTAPESALLRGALFSRGQHVRYVPGRVVHNMTGAFAGEGTTDARDVMVIAAASDEEIYDHLRGHGVRRPTIPKMIAEARAAAAAQTVTLPGEATTARLLQQAAASLMVLTRQIAELDEQITEVPNRESAVLLGRSPPHKALEQLRSAVGEIHAALCLHGSHVSVVDVPGLCHRAVGSSTV
nr:IS110 family transposase [Gordonia soli]